MIEIIFGMLGGLALFIYGLKTMSESLRALAGKKAHKFLGAITTLPIIGILAGALVTAITQSSTLVTVMVVGFVNTSMLNLKQAISVIMGANIGTTLTAQLVAFRITDMWVYFAAVGFPVYFFFRRKLPKNVGMVSFSLAMLLLGMGLMSAAMVPLRADPNFARMIVAFSDNRVLGMLVGAVFTAIIQSSTAATGVIVAMTMQDLIPFEAALPLILGTNVGTTATAVLASIGGTVSARRAAMAHVLFNFIGALIFLIFIDQYAWFIQLISPGGDVPRQVANAHTMFSLISAALFLPFINQFAKLLTKIVRGEDFKEKRGPIYLDDRLLNTPDVAIKQARAELVRLAEIAGENTRLAFAAFIERDSQKLAKCRDLEDQVDDLEKEITGYLTKITQRGMTEDLTKMHTKLLNAANDVERVSDHADNIADLAEVAIENDVNFSDTATAELKAIYAAVIESYSVSVTSIRKMSVKTAKGVDKLEEKIDKMEKDMRKNHTERLKNGICNAEASGIFVDMIINFERIGDHAVNLAKVAV